MKLQKSGVVSRRSGLKRLTKVIVFRTPPPSAHQATEARISHIHVPKKVIDANNFHRRYDHSHEWGFVA